MRFRDPVFAWVLFAACGCGPDTDRLDLTLSFATPGAEARALGIRVRVARGTCSDPGEVVHEYEIVGGMGAEASPPLEPGRYAVLAEARDASCSIFAEGCAERQLPSDGALHVAMTGVSAPRSLCTECEYCDGAGGCVSGTGDVCGHEQVVCELVAAGTVVAGGYKGRFVIGSDPTRPICAEVAPASCGDELRGCVTSRFGGAMDGHLHRVAWKVHEAGGASAAPPGGAERIVFAGDGSFDAYAADATMARGSFVGLPQVDAAEGHTHGVECEIYDEVDADGVPAAIATAASWTIATSGSALAFCVESGACAAHLRCTVR